MQPSSKRLKTDTVVDEQGRRRFHGAFTGGFSAGYYNTVGSEEGWKPQTFTSKRGQKSNYKQQSVLDFADDEDGLLGSKLLMKEDFVSDSSKGADNKASWLDPSGAIPGPIMKELIVASSRTVGIRLLQKMGWKEGQGVGARVRMDAHEAVDKSKVPSSALDYGGAGITKAPSDYTITIPVPKADLYGLGFVPTSSSRSKALAKGSSVYAVSNLFTATNTQDNYMFDDEEDAYGPAQQDFIQEEALLEEEEDVAPQRSTRQGISSWVNSSSARSKCSSDGRHVLEGFTLGEAFTQLTLEYPPVVPPEGYQPARELFATVVKKPKMSRWTTAPPADSAFTLSAEAQDKLKATIASTAPLEPLHQEAAANERRALVSEAKLSRFSALSDAFKSRFVSASSSLSSATIAADKQLSGLKSASEFSSTFQETKLATSEASQAATTRPVRTNGARRTTVDWTPASLLCKRFNVPGPAHTAASQGGHPASKDRESELFERHIGAFVSDEAAKAVVTAPTEAPEPESNDPLSNVAMSVATRPALSMLKSIFDSDSEEEEEEQPPVKVKHENDESAAVVEPLAQDYIASRNLVGGAEVVVTQNALQPPEGPVDGKIVFMKPTKPRAAPSSVSSSVAATERPLIPKAKQQSRALSFNMDE